VALFKTNPVDGDDVTFLEGPYERLVVERAKVCNLDESRYSLFVWTLKGPEMESLLAAFGVGIVVFMSLLYVNGWNTSLRGFEYSLGDGAVLSTVNLTESIGADFGDGTVHTFCVSNGVRDCAEIIDGVCIDKKESEKKNLKDQTMSR